MRSTNLVTRAGLLGAMLAGLSIIGLAADPGTAPPATAEVSDLKYGSVLVYPYYTSSAASPSQQNTRISITNHNSTTDVAIRLLFISNSGSIADAVICLTKNQTAQFLVSDIDPGLTGLVMAVAETDTPGQPINFNFLTGAADVKLPGGQRASFKAEAIAAIAATPTSWMPGNTTATLNFDGVSYNRLPRTLAVDKLKSAADGNVTMLAIARVGGSYTAAGTAPAIGALSGTLFNDTPTSAPFSFSHGSPLFVQTLSDSFPATTPVYSQLLSAGRTGWLKLAADNDYGLFGVLLNFNANTASNARAFSGGHNLRKLTLTASSSVTIDVFAANCID